jgi:DNA-directed RNA polymerase subunit RPC12/RpoP
MDIIFKCPHCEQEMEVDASGAGTEIECPSCSNQIVVPPPDPAAVADGAAEPPTPPPVPAKAEKHFAVPVHQHTPEALIKKPRAKPLDIIAKEGDKTMRIKTIKRTDCQEVGKDHFDETVSEFLEKVGQLNIVSVHTVNYSYVDVSTRQILLDYGVVIVFKG